LVVEPLPRAPRLFDPEVENLGEEPASPQPGDGTEKKPGSGEQGRARPHARPFEWARLLPFWLAPRVAHAASQPPPASIILRWERIPGVESYVIQIAQDESFSQVIVEQEVTSTFFRWTRISKRVVWWRVQSVDAKGRKGEFSPPSTVGVVMAAPTVTDPDDGARYAIGIGRPQVDFAWEAVRLAAQYEVSIATDAGFAQPITTFTTRSPTATWQVPGAGTFYWRVRVADATGATTSHSSVRKLVVFLAAPKGLAPAAGKSVTLTADGPTLRLSASVVATATEYEFQVAKAGGFDEPIHRAKEPKPTTTWRVSAPGPWRWRARAVGAAGVRSGWSAPLTFHVALATPVITAPADGARFAVRAAEAAVEVTWEPVPGADQYEVIVRAQSSQGDVTGARAQQSPARVTGLSAGAYEVAVVATTGDVSSPAPARWHRFELALLPPLGIPVLRDPKNEAQFTTGEQPPVVDFAWDAVNDAAGYEIEVGLAPSAEASVAQTHAERVDGATEVKRADFQVGTWAWRVRAVGGDGTPGEYSAARRFTVVESDPDSAPVFEGVLSPTIILGGAVGFVTNFEGVLSPTLTVEAGSRLPFVDERLAASIRVGYHFAKVTRAGTPSIDATQHAIPIAVGARWDLPPIGVVPYVGGSMLLGVLHARFDDPGQPAETLVGFGAEGAVGAWWKLGPGSLFAEVRYGWMRRSSDTFDLDGGGLVPVAGYRIEP
ncbi:MAG: hypothetical protein V3T05_01905, partial [Myxococcota bacterium]